MDDEPEKDNGGKKVRVHLPDLPPPWEAYFHKVRKKLFYLNRETKTSVWYYPIPSSPVSNEKNLEKPSFTHYVKPDRKSMACPYGRSDSKKEKDKKRNCERPRAYPSTSSADFKSYSSSSFDKAHEWLYKQNFSACVVLDTSALMKQPGLLEMNASKKVLSIVPLNTIQELDLLKNADTTKKMNNARRAGRELVHETTYNPSFIKMESEMEKRTPLLNFNPRTNDDYIMKCALQYREKVLLARIVSERRFQFLSNDNNLILRARGQGLNALSTDEYLEKMGFRSSDLPASDEDLLVTSQYYRLPVSSCSSALSPPERPVRPSSVPLSEYELERGFGEGRSRLPEQKSSLTPDRLMSSFGSNKHDFSQKEVEALKMDTEQVEDVEMEDVAECSSVQSSQEPTNVFDRLKKALRQNPDALRNQHYQREKPSPEPAVTTKRIGFPLPHPSEEGRRVSYTTYY
ncbi:unnamed protein product [Caenorhabditis auriculariae]|uniref:WW domain-containing protein n=1 Tax=Caenorhabditis auriculariae TaxID=2777116 RepID=A0A8S1HI22_9PELO|nr:unnamed protein product [Caenorhabditis auriculariae]